MTRILLLFPLFLMFSWSVSQAQCSVTANAGPDKYLCAPATTTMLSGSTVGTPLSVFWTPTTGLNNPNIPTPTATVSTTTTYTFHATAIQWADDLIVNGDFESGNNAFTSAYTYTPGDIYTEGTYDIIPNPANSHPDFAPCTDHTAAPGTNMMVINGTGNPNTVVWCQTVPVTPGTQYAFSAWATSIVSSSPAVLQIFINGVQIGVTTTLSSATCVWSNLTAMWSSGSASSAVICIVNQNTALSGNDFAMDDLVFAPVCESTDQMTVNVINITASASPIIYNIPCEGSEIMLNASNSSSGPNITYSWFSLTGHIVSGGNTLTPIVDEAGIYTLTVTYSDGNVTCTKNTSVNVVLDPNGLFVSIFPPGQLGCDPSEITISALANQPNNQLTFSWNTVNGNVVSGDNTSAIIVDAAGTYTVTATNNINGCTSTASVTVSANAAYPTAIATGGAIGCLNPNTLISGIGSTIGAGFMYEWTTTNGTIISGGNGLNPTVGAPGVYTLTVLNPNNGCSSSDTAIVISDANVPVVTITTPGNLDCDNGSLLLFGTISPANATFIWTTSNGGNISGGNNTLTPTAGSAGTYNLIATNPLNGCKDTATVMISANTTPPIAIATVMDSLDCGNSSVVVHSAGSSTGAGFQVQWTTTNGFIVSGNNSADAIVNQAGTYILTVTNNNNGCSSSDTVQVILNQSTINAVAFANNAITCIINQVTLSGAGSSTGTGLSYSWTTSNGTILSGANTLSPVVTAAGTYQLLVSNINNGCSDTASVLVIADLTPPSISINTPEVLTCVETQGSLICNFLGGNVFAWQVVGGGNIVSGSNTASPVYNSPGGYCVTLTNSSNGCQDTACTTVSENIAFPLALASSAGSINCQNASVQVFSTGSSTGTNMVYHWTTTNGNVSGGDNSATATVNAAGIYVLEVMDTLNGCTDTSWVTVQADVNAVLAVANTPGQLDCDTDSLTLNANGSTMGIISYLWTTPNGNINSGADTPAPVVSEPGSYILQLSSLVNGCSSTDTVLVTEDLVPPVAIALSEDSLGCTAGTVVLSSTGSSTGADFSYQWTTLSGNITMGATSTTPVVNAAGDYILVITDTTNACSATATVTVIADANVPVAVIAPAGELNCSITTLSLNAGASSSGGTYTYAWTGGNIISGNNGLLPVVDAAGTYILTVTNTQNQCTATASIVVAEDTIVPAILPVPVDTLTCTDPEFLLDGQVGNPASGAMIFLWQTTTGSFAGDPANAAVLCDAPGIYNLTVTNTDNDCEATVQVNMAEDVTAPAITIDPPATITCAQSQVTLQATADINTVTWSWVAGSGGNIMSGDNTANPVVDEPGDYIVQVTNNNNGCFSNGLATVTQNAIFPMADAGNPAVLNCYTPTLTLSGNGDAGIGITYLWQTTDGTINSGNQTLTPIISAAGTYTLYVSNQATGCTGNASVQITEDLLPPNADAGSTAILNCGTTSILLDGSLSDTGAGFSYQWGTLNGNILNGDNMISPEVNAPGTYTLTVTNTNNGCTQSAAVGVINDSNAPVANAGLPDTLTCVTGQLTLLATASQGATISYDWMATNGGNIVSGNQTLNPVVDAPGNYILNVSDSSNGCNTISSVTIAENIATPDIQAGLPQLLTCSVQSINLQGNTSLPTGNFAVSWTTPDGNILSGAGTLTPMVNASGIYTASLTDLQNGCNNTAAVLVSIDTIVPQVTTAASQPLTCIQTDVPINGTLVFPLTDYSVAWTAMPGGNISGAADQLNTTVSEPGIYTVTIENNLNGCINTNTVQVNEDVQPPVAAAGAAALLTCTTTNTTLDGSGSSTGTGFSYAWTALDGTGVVSGASSLSPLINEPGTYELLVTNSQNGCTDTDQVVVGMDQELPVAAIAAPQSLTCLQDTVVLDAGASDAGANIVLTWTNPGGVPFIPADAYFPAVTAAGQYTLVVLNTANGCTDIATASLVADQNAPSAEAGPGFALHCNQMQVNLQGSSNAQDITYSWSTTAGNILSGQQTATPLIGQAGDYQLLVTDLSNGCTATDIVSITEIPLPELQMALVQPNCLSPLGFVTISNTTGGTAPFSYGLDGVYQPAPVFGSLVPGVYTISVQDANGCEYMQSAVIAEPFEITLSIENLHQLVLGEQYQLTPVLNVPNFQIDTWEWSPAEGLSCTDCPSPIASPLQATNYAVTVTDVNGCTAAALTQVLVVADREIFAPNIFSPNGDGFNDFFTIFGKALSQINTLRVYDRWGNQLFQKDQFAPNDESAGWDGRFHEKTMMPGVYAWYAEIAFIDGLVLLFKGDVTVVE